MKTAETARKFLEAKQDLSPRTLEQYVPALDFLVMECPKMPGKPDPLRKALSKVKSEWVKDSYWRVWKAFFRWCRGEYDTPNPMERVEKPKPDKVQPRVLGPQDLSFVLAAAEDIRDKAILALALDSGVRASEFGYLRIGDIGNDTIWLWGKGRKRLEVPIRPETRHLLQLLIDQDGKGGTRSLVFPGDNGMPISRFAVYSIVRKCLDHAGIAGPKRGSHLLRHSLATGFLSAGGDLTTLQRIMRHQNLSTTQVYVHLDMSTIVESHHEYSPVRDAIRGAQGVLIKREALEEVDGILLGRNQYGKGNTNG